LQRIARSAEDNEERAQPKALVVKLEGDPDSMFYGAQENAIAPAALPRKSSGCNRLTESASAPHAPMEAMPMFCPAPPEERRA
jgi:hypothetical protein